jgi:hypothetical protein
MPGLPSLLLWSLLAQQPSANPGTTMADARLVIASDSSCPTVEAVREALGGLRPAAEWPATIVVIRTTDQLVSIDLGARGQGERQLAIGPDCAARATSAALVIATWMNDLPAEVAGPPVLRPQVVTKPAPLPVPRNPAVHELGASISVGASGGLAPGLRAEFIRMRAERGLGWQASIALHAPRELSVGTGETHWMRATASMALHARHASRRVLLAAELGAVGAYTAAWGSGYAEDRTDQSLTWGLAAAVRAGIPWGRFRLWTDLRACRWLYQQGVQIDSATPGDNDKALLPAWDGQWSLGMGYVLP